MILFLLGFVTVIAGALGAYCLVVEGENKDLYERNKALREAMWQQAHANMDAAIAKLKEANR